MPRVEGPTGAAFARIVPVAGLQRSAFPALACKSRARHPWRARSAGQTSTGPLPISASPLSRPFGLNLVCAPRSACFKGRKNQTAVHKDVRVPRVQATYRRWEVRTMHGAIAGRIRAAFGCTHPMYRKHKCRGRTEAQERPRLDRRRPTGT